MFVFYIIWKHISVLEPKNIAEIYDKVMNLKIMDLNVKLLDFIKLNKVKTYYN